MRGGGGGILMMCALNTQPTELAVHFLENSESVLAYLCTNRNTLWLLLLEQNLRAEMSFSGGGLFEVAIWIEWIRGNSFREKPLSYCTVEAGLAHLRGRDGVAPSLFDLVEAPSPVIPLSTSRQQIP